MADETLDVELNETVKDAFYPALKTQLTKHLGESDSTLFEYIVLLISNKRTKTHIINDLQAFFQDSAKEFTQWLWEFLKPYEKSESGSVMSALTDGGEDDQAREKENEKRSRSSKKDDSGDKKPRKDSRENDRSERSEKRTERSDRDRRRSASPKEKRVKPSGTTNPGASRLFGNALPKTSDLARDVTRRKREVVKDANGNSSNGYSKEEESHNEEEAAAPLREEKDITNIKVSKVVVKKRRTDRSRSPDNAAGDEDDPEREDKSRDRTRDRDRKDSGKARTRDERRSTRLGSDGKVKTEKKSGKVAPHFTITLDGAPPLKPLPTVVRAVEDEDDDGYIMGGGTRAGVIVTGVPDLKPVVLANEDDSLPPEIQAAYDDLPVGGALTGAEAIRCRFWPKCKKEDCPFHHPKEICPYYPSCKFGSACLFIHVVADGGRGRGRGRPAPYRGAYRGAYRGRGGHHSTGVESEGKEGETKDDEATESSTPRGRGGYRGRVRGRGRGAANSSKVYDASGVLCRFDTFCTAIGCPYQHPVRDSNEQNFLSSSELSDKPAKSATSSTTTSAASNSTTTSSIPEPATKSGSATS